MKHLLGFPLGLGLRVFSEVKVTVGRLPSHPTTVSSYACRLISSGPGGPRSFALGYVQLLGVFYMSTTLQMILLLNLP